MTQTNYFIRPFDPSIDVAQEIALQHLNIRLHQEAVGENTFANIFDSWTDLSKIQSHYVEPGGNFFVAEDASTSQRLGFIGLRYDSESRGSIKRLAVEPEFQGQKIGSCLVGAALTWAWDNSFNYLSLETNVDEYAMPIYKKFGFEIVGYLGGHEDWVMELSNGSSPPT